MSIDYWTRAHAPNLEWDAHIIQGQFKQLLSALILYMLICVDITGGYLPIVNERGRTLNNFHLHNNNSNISLHKIAGKIQIVHH